MALNGWKITAIIFIVLFIAETVFIISAYNVGTESINNKLKCSNEICFNIEADAFIYDSDTKTCSCYEGNDIVKQEVLR